MKIFKNLDTNDLENEIWKTIIEYLDYQVSNLGRIKSFKYDKINGKILKQDIDIDGYLHVNLYKNKNKKNIRVNRIVYETYIKKLEENYDTHHINEDRSCNFVNNLESKEHRKHSRDHHLYKKLSDETKRKIGKSSKGRTHSEETKRKISNSEKGKDNPNSVLIIQDIVQIKFLLKEGKLSQHYIASVFNVARTTISSIKRGITWNYIKI